jgi:hypothetical protein
MALFGIEDLNNIGQEQISNPNFNNHIIDINIAGQINSAQIFRFLSFILYKRNSKSGQSIRISVVGFENDVKRFLNTLYSLNSSSVLIILDRLEKIQNSPYMSLSITIEYDLWKRLYEYSIRFGYYNLIGQVNLSRVFFMLNQIPSRISLQDLQNYLSQVSLLENLAETSLSTAQSLLGIVNISGEDYSDWAKDINIQNISENTTVKKKMEISHKTIVSGCAVKNITKQIMESFEKTKLAYLPPTDCDEGNYQLNIQINDLLSGASVKLKMTVIISANCQIYGIKNIIRESSTTQKLGSPNILFSS